MTRRALRRRVVASFAAVVATAAALGGAELVLLDGRVLRGESLREDNGIYVLTTPSGDLTMPVELVSVVRLTGPAEPKPPVMEGIPEGPTGMRVGPPQTLAGAAFEPPTTEEQTRALGRSSQFQRSVVDPGWEPESDWNMDPDVQNNWAPSTWAKAPIDSTWAPRSAFDASDDVLADSRSIWRKSPIDSTWTPTDGFAKNGS